MGGYGMTREEEIIEAGIDYTMNVRPMCIGGLAFEKEIRQMNRNKSFEEGAKWADSHPYLSEEEQVGMGGLGMMWQKKNLIDKACEWLKENLPNRMYDRNCCLDNFTEYLISDLRKYLEG